MEDLHLEVLDRLCRLCGGQLRASGVAVGQKSFRAVETHAETLLLHFGTDVNKEESSIFPKKLCNKCRVRLDRLRKKDVPQNLVIHSFICHKDDCFCLELAKELGIDIQAFEPIQIDEQMDFTCTVDHGYAASDVRTPPATPKIDRRKKKVHLREANCQYVKRQRLKGLIDGVDNFCAENFEDKIDTAYFLLTQRLIDAGKRSEADRILSIWNSEADEDMSAAECLAMRVRTLQSKTHYRQTYNIQKDKTSQNILKPPKSLNAVEHTFLPGYCEYKLLGQDGTILLQQELLSKAQCEPSDIMSSFETFSSDFPLPNISGVQFNYVSCVARALFDLEKTVKEKLVTLGLPTDTPVKTLIKDGWDGLGDIKVKKRKGDFSLTDKVFRYSFCILSCVATVGNVEHVLFSEDHANSVDSTIPVVLANCDESDWPSIVVTLSAVSRLRELMRNSISLLLLVGGSVVREHSLQLIYSMVDEKFERTSSGLQGSGSRFICTLCEATTKSCECDVGSFDRTRTSQETISLYKYRLENPNSLNENDLADECKGVKAIPFIISEACERSVDATHANINMGRVFKKILVREVASVYESAENDKNKNKLQHAEKLLDEHLRATIGLQSELMMPGNYARALFAPENLCKITEIIKIPERKDHVCTLLSLHSRMHSVYSCKKPLIEMPLEAAKYRDTALQFAFCLGEHFPYVRWSNYMHRVVEHVHEIIQDPAGVGSVGLLSSEGGESGNKLFRHIRKALSRQDSKNDLRDAIIFHWLYTSKVIQQHAFVAKFVQQCSRCGESSHNIRTCTYDQDTINPE